MPLNTVYKKMKPVPVIVKLTDGQVIEGSINIGFEDRVTDFLCTPEKHWIPVFDVDEGKDVIIVNKLQTVSVQPKP